MIDANAAAEAAALAMPALPRLDMPCHAWPSHSEPCAAAPEDYRPYFAKLQRVLDRMGGVYALDDILTRINDGRMQSFAVNNSWVVTEIQVFPRARQLQVIALVGDIGDTKALNDVVLDFARKVDVDLVSTHGRRGWLEQGHALGWRLKSRSFLWQKDL
jgi:hypothetical protein